MRDKLSYHVQQRFNEIYQVLRRSNTSAAHPIAAHRLAMIRQVMVSARIGYARA